MSVPYVFSIAAVFAVVQIKVESRGKINVWIPWHGTPCREQVEIIDRESCHKFKVLTNPHISSIVYHQLVWLSYCHQPPAPGYCVHQRF